MTALNIEKLQRIYTMLEIFPNGISKNDLALLCDLTNGDLDSSLASMDKAGLWLSEDQNGRLYHFSKDWWYFG